MIAAGPEVAAALAAVLGPTTLVLARHTMTADWRPASTEVALVTGVSGLGSALVLTAPRLAPVMVPLAVLGPAAALVDAQEGRLPDALTGPLLAITLLSMLGSGTAGTRGIVAAGLALGGALAIKVAASELIGWGDVKLAPTLGIVLGYQNVIVEGLLYTTALVAVSAVVITFRRHGSGMVPYGPALLSGALCAVVGV